MVRCRFDDLVAGTAFELVGLQRELFATRVEEVPELLVELEHETSVGRYAAGFVAYEAAPAFDSALRVREDEATSSLPLAWFAVFAERRECAVVEPLAVPIGGPWVSEIDEEAYGETFDAVKQQIEAGWTYQVNLSSRLRRSYDADPYLLYRQLATAQEGAYHGYLETASWAVACGSPELFFSLDGDVVTSRPMKGTAARGRWPVEDMAQAAGLLASPKERAENVMIVDLIRNDLGRVAVFGSVEVPELFALERYPTLWTLTSTVRARLNSSTSLSSVFGALFPCGSVTGAPKASTMGLIARLERSARGVYCGAIGYVAPPGSSPSAQFAVGIRTAVLDRTAHIATYGTGSGVTWDSTASAEWAEIATKATVLGSVPAHFGLFETMRYEPSEGIVNLSRHLSRLGRSAAYFGFPFARGDAVRTLEAALADLPEVSRVRLDLDRSGAIRAEVEPLAAVKELPLRLELDTEPVDPSDPMLFHKTTERSVYDLRAVRHPNADDVVLVNGAGEVTETSRANLLVQLGGRWWTPRLEAGLLPGIERGRLIDAGEVAERAITVDELRRADAIETVSSLRGRRPAVFVVEP